MSPAIRCLAAATVVLAAAALVHPDMAAAQGAPTLPSDTLSANYAPPSTVAPSPELAPSLPSDTIEIGAPLPETYDSMVTDTLNAAPASDDSTDFKAPPSPQ
jgi:hypothetical protein